MDTLVEVVVSFKTFREIDVAVKELLPRTNVTDVLREAKLLSTLSHPYLPYLIGVCTKTKPYKIVTQFHSYGTRAKSLTLQRAILEELQLDVATCLSLSAQLFEGLQYIHDEANIIHNDLKTNNILLSNIEGRSNVHIIIIDFGKATHAEKGLLFSLSESEKAEYTRSFQHMSPEVIAGITRQNTKSDIYAAGGILHWPEMFSRC